MNKYRLTEDMAQDRKYWMTKIMTGPAQGDGQEIWERREKYVVKIHSHDRSEPQIVGINHTPRVFNTRRVIDVHLSRHEPVRH